MLFQYQKQQVTQQQRFLLLIRSNRRLNNKDFFYLMRQQRQEEAEYDVYFRGTKQQLYAFLYPLSGPDSSLFDHLEMKKNSFDVEKKAFQVKYQPKDFQNIDKQKEQVTYKSTLLPTQSNYFYSTFQPQYSSFIWQSIDHFVEMRPQSKGMSSASNDEAMQEEDKTKIELQVIDFERPDNKAKEILDDAITTPLKQNWEVSKDEYLTHLAN